MLNSWIGRAQHRTQIPDKVGLGATRRPVIDSIQEAIHVLAPQASEAAAPIDSAD